MQLGSPGFRFEPPDGYTVCNSLAVTTFTASPIRRRRFAGGGSRNRHTQTALRFTRLSFTRLFDFLCKRGATVRRGSMFERYTEKARRVIFFARYEASQFGSPYIETEHLLLGLLREDKALTNRFLRSHASVESIRKQIEQHTTVREKVSTSVDLPLSNECKRVLAYAAEEAERLSHKHIGTEHLLLGLLREEKCFAAEILTERGLRLPAIREELQAHHPGKARGLRPAAASRAAAASRSSRCSPSFRAT